MNHKFDIDVAMTATIDSKIVIDIITDVVEKQTGKKVSDIYPKYNGSVLESFHVVFDPQSSIKKHAFKPSKEFIVENFGAED